MKNKDIIIIGSGVLGYSAALSLLEKDPTVSITLIGHRHRAGSATLAAGAMLGCYGEITESHLSSKYGKAKFECSFDSKNMWPEWLAFVNNKAGQNVKINEGTFIVHNNASGLIDSKNYRTILDTLDEKNEKYETVKFEDIPGINTQENKRSLDAIYIPGEGSLCGSSFLETLSQAAESYQNFKHLDDEVISLEVKAGQISRVTLKNNGTLFGATFILAAGSFSQKILDTIPDIAAKIPRILSGSGHSLILTQNENPVKNVIRTPNRAGACGLHVLPYQDYMYVGATNDIKTIPDETFSAGWIHFLLECVLEQINQNLFNSKIVEMKVGNRPSPMDGFPLVGYTSIDNLYLLTGTYRDGFHQSPYLAEAVAEDILHQKPVMDNMFTPERAPIITMSRDEAIKEAVEHQMASAYEAGADLPPAFWDGALERYLEGDVREFYDILGANMNLLPEHTLMLREHRSNTQLIDYFKAYFKKSTEIHGPQVLEDELLKAV